MSEASLEFIRARLSNSLNSKGGRSAKFDDALLKGENRTPVVNFVSGSGNKRVLAAWIGGGDNLMVANEVPKTFRRKLAYFVKPAGLDSKKDLDVSTLREKVVFGEVSENVLTNLKGIVDGVVLPLVRNPKNRKGWPSVSTRQLLMQVEKFKTGVNVAVGQAMGKTLLPPAVPQAFDEQVAEKERVQHLQAAVIRWSELVSTVLARKPQDLTTPDFQPQPLDEIKFWKGQKADLDFVQQQLRTVEIQSVLKALSEYKSPLVKSFSEIEARMANAMDEAQENLRYLRVLEKYFRVIGTASDIKEIYGAFPAVLHLMIKVWKVSKTYNTRALLVNLMREISNSLIDKASRICSGSEIWKYFDQEDIGEALELLDRGIDLCQSWKRNFVQFQKVASAELPDNGSAWDVNPSDVFIRVNAFIERCGEIKEFLSAARCYQKIDPNRVVFGASKGLQLTEHLGNIYGRFQKAAKDIRSVKYDITDIDAEAFDVDFFAFRQKIKQLDRTLAAMLIDSYEDNETVLSRMDLMDVFEDMLKRPEIQDEMEKKETKLLFDYRDELLAVQAKFAGEKAAPWLDVNKPPLAGGLQWCGGLIARVSGIQKDIMRFTKNVMVSEIFTEVTRLHDIVMEQLNEYMGSAADGWKAEVKATSQSKLDLPLLVRDEKTRSLTVNFDASLARTLGEVRYLHLYHQDVPDYAEVIYEQNEKYREFICKLDLLKNMYNFMTTELLDVEYPLIADDIKTIDGLLEDGLSSINWNSEGARVFIDKNLKKVTEVYDRVTLMRDNYKVICDTLDEFSKVPLMTRKSKPMAASGIAELIKNVAIDKEKGRHHELGRRMKKVGKLLSKSCQVLEVDKSGDDWKNYLVYVEKSILKYLATTVIVSLQYMIDQLDDKRLTNGDIQPLIALTLILNEEKDVEFTAVAEDVTEDSEEPRDVWQIMSSWADAFMDVGEITKKFSESESYLEDLKESKEDITIELDGKRGKLTTNLQKQRQLLQQLLDKSSSECTRIRNKYEEFKVLWADTLEDEFNGFFNDLLEKKKKLKKANAEDDRPRKKTSESDMELKEFEKKIVFYREIRAKAEALDAGFEVSWLKVNAAPIQDSLLDWASKRINNYMSYLFNDVMFKLNTVEMQMMEVNSGLREVDPESETVSDELKTVLNYIMVVRTREKEVKKMFGPMRKTVKLLTKYGRAFSEEDNKSLADAPQKWEATCKKVDKVSESIQDLQTVEVDKIQERVRNYFDTVLEMRREFQSQKAFSFATDVIDAYMSMEEQYNKLNEVEIKIDQLTSEELLFECENKSASYKKKIDLCRTENRALKVIWDMASIVHYTFKSWDSQLWHDIDAENLGDECKKLQKQLRLLKKQCGQYKAYLGLDDKVKNMLVILPLISDLHSESMKPRHWDRLMKETGKQFVMGPNFCLKDMLDLELHKFQETVGDIVDEADKQAKIKIQLGKIGVVWADMKLEYKKHKTGVTMIQASEDLMIALEENMASLQTMQAQGKFVEFFRKEVDFWTDCLRTVETVYNDCLAVQNTWGSLETIFIGSEDIREQLPDDAARFEKIDANFRALLKEVAQEPLVTKALNDKKRQTALEEMKKGLDQCEKSLFAYLEVKRMVFPRFYFIANAALLDILSNGRNPQMIQKHIESNFNNVKKLQFRKDEKSLNTPELKAFEQMVLTKGTVWSTRWEKKARYACKDLAAKFAPKGLSDEKQKEWFMNLYSEWKSKPFTKYAVGMYSKAGYEYIQFHEPYLCDGAVELWLKKLVAHHQKTMQIGLSNAKDSSDNWNERPRHKWLYDYSCQHALTASFTVFTEEVEAQFEALSEGNETALKDYLKMYDDRLGKLVDLVLGRLNKRDRKKIVTIITIDVHSRDVVQMLIEKKVPDADKFDWQKQLRYYWDKKQMASITRVMDSEFKSNFEYIGNTGRLVITPLTDRCYITLSQALTLKMGGAPAGPAGTGKTETVKDLARGLGFNCYVFNGSPQMNVESMAAATKGLSQTGAWGCFDEFNRIRVEVLSVYATQVTEMLNALKANQDEFEMSGTTLKLLPTVGLFITMNPGYAGRTELPENLKALFRPCAMVVPDTRLICENMLMSEGFRGARILAYKFTTLYSLSKELLTQQRFYDWGLRATAALLRVAGGLKRSAPPGTDEDIVLMRALRDFNLPKLVQEDKAIFRQLCADLFPGRANVTRVLDEELAGAVKKAAVKMKLQPEKEFLFKVVELQELFNIRHSVFIIGPECAGKTKIWNTLAEANELLGRKTVYRPLNAKAVTNDQLYGFLTKTEWNDGILSTIMRDMSYNNAPFTEEQVNKWVVCDGDVDTLWIESLNTVMDANKTLTLVSNERIPLSESMRMLFEVANLNHASPATVSRAGILYVNPEDIGPKPFLDSWLQRQMFGKTGKPDEKLRSSLSSLFNKYVSWDDLYEIKRETMPVVPVGAITKVKSLCFLLEGLLDEMYDATFKSMTKSQIEEYDTLIIDDAAQAKLEAQFVFAAVWALGGMNINEKNNDSLKRFNMWWRVKHKKNVTYEVADPKAPFDVFAYYPDEKNKMVEWKDVVRKYVPGKRANLVTSVFIPTAVTMRVTRIIDLIVKTAYTPAGEANRDGREQCWAPMLVGNAGTGKTAIIENYLRNEADKHTIFKTINLNFYTNAVSLKAIMETVVSKRQGLTFGPPIPKKLVYFIDDINMQEVDLYDTQTTSEHIRQHMDYGVWYDTKLLDQKKIVDTTYIAAMNPKAGSFMIAPRLQGHFQTIGCMMPKQDTLKGVYMQVMTDRLKDFSDDVKEMAEAIVDATVEIHGKVCDKFLPSSVKFHYMFNMRELGKLFQGLCRVPKNATPTTLLRLFCHESSRVFKDRLINKDDMTAFSRDLESMRNKYFPNIAKKMDAEDAKAKKESKGNDSKGDSKADDAEAEPIIFTTFESKTPGEYVPIKDMKNLRTVLDTRLEEYNEENPAMDLVLFGMAMEHVTRIARMLEQDGTNMLLVGVGGSGKQSLSRLAAKGILGYEVFQIKVTMSYREADLMTDLQTLFRLTGEKGKKCAFLLTDNQIVNDEWLVYINDTLSSGYIPELFAPEEIEGICASLRAPAKAAGIPDNPTALMDFFIQRVRNNLHIVLCFSPVGSVMRVRCRKFPAIISQTQIDIFHPWPRSALKSVAERFISTMPMFENDDKMLEPLSSHMAEVHLAVEKASDAFLRREKRYFYTTPKSFLELIAFYKKLYAKKKIEIDKNTERLEKGIAVLANTGEKVAELQEDLKRTMIIVEEKKVAAAKAIKKANEQKAIVEKEQAVADVEAKKASVIQKRATDFKNQCQDDLDKVQPILDAATAAVDCLEVKQIQTFKSFTNPPAGTPLVTDAVAILLGKDKKPWKPGWKSGKKLLGEPGKLITELKDYDGRVIPLDRVVKAEKIIKKEVFNVEIMKKKSEAAANLCGWVINIVRFFRVYQDVEPKMKALDAAQAEAKGAADEVKRLNDKVAALQKLFEKAVATKNKAENEKKQVEEDAERCRQKLATADRLVGGLADEKIRWGGGIEELKKENDTIMGDTMLAASFVSYIGAFDARFRLKLWRDTWIKDLEKKQIQIKPGIDPLKMLASDSDFARWQNEGLAADRNSLENAAIVSECSRWPLLIDPQLQGARWIEKHFTKMKQITLNTRNWMRIVKEGVQFGYTVYLHSILEELDASLDPVIAQQIIKSRGGKGAQINLGEMIDYDMNFKLVIQTKLPNPHYKPEIAAQTTLINFMVTERGLEDQLLALVVNKERPDLEAKKAQLVRSINEYNIQLADLEDKLLAMLNEADPAKILENIELIDGLEMTKKKSTEVDTKIKEAQQAEILINEARNKYREVAQESSWIYFLLIQLWNIDHMYQYSLEAFTSFFFKAIERAPKPPKADDVKFRVSALRTTIRITIFRWVNRGTFSKHRLIMVAQLLFKLLRRGAPDLNAQFNREQFEFLMICPKKLDEEKPKALKWMPDPAWGAVCALSEVKGFDGLMTDVVASPNRFREWYNKPRPEVVPLPSNWRKLISTDYFMHMCVVRAIRPDRLTSCMTTFAEKTIPDGKSFTNCDAGISFSKILQLSLKDSTPLTPIFFILSPGADPVVNLQEIARSQGYFPNKWRRVSLGEGQDVIAMRNLEQGVKEGYWVVLENIHLMTKWIGLLEKALAEYEQENAFHPDFRLFLSAEPELDIPIGILERSIKLTNEPPQGLVQNLKRAFATFEKEEFEEKDTKIKMILFALAHYHAIIVERCKYGPKGWNRKYPFNVNDLFNSGQVLSNYLERSDAGDRIPWSDLRYIFGEILYGGHITDDWDRRLNMTYMRFFFNPDLLEGIEFFPYSSSYPDESFPSPEALPYDDYFQYIDEYLTVESPVAFGMHPNAEIAVATVEANNLMAVVQDLQPKDDDDDDIAAADLDDPVAAQLSMILERVKPINFDTEDIANRIGQERGPYQNVFLQECDRMNVLVTLMVDSLEELELGMRGELQMSEKMEQLARSLELNRVPPSWAKKAYPSLRALGSWLDDLMKRGDQLQTFVDDPVSIPVVVDLSKCFNPQSFLTAIMQVTAQTQQKELDKLVIMTDVTNKQPADIEQLAREGANVCGMYLEAARWDQKQACLAECLPRVLFAKMPVVICRAILREKLEKTGVYRCPCYKTTQRGPTYVFDATLKSRHPEDKWILAGVVMLLEVPDA